MVPGTARTTLPDGGEIEYLVDGAQRRIGRRVFSPQGTLTDAKYWLYKDALNPIAELYANGRLVKRFAYGSKPHSPEYMIEFDPATGAEVATYRMVTDHLGSVRMVVDTSDGSVVQRMHYDAWGNVLEDTNQGFQPFGYSGGLYDTRTELVRFGARDYDPRLGRWSDKDPIGFGGGDSNLYAYVFHNPTSFVDPAGDLPIFVPILIGMAVGGVADAGIQYWQKGEVDMGQVAISAAAGGVGGAGGWLARGALAAKGLRYSRAAHIAADSTIGALTAGGAQMSASAYYGEELTDGVVQACVLGAGLGAVGSYASSKMPKAHDVQWGWWQEAIDNYPNMAATSNPTKYLNRARAAQAASAGIRSSVKQGGRPFKEQ